VIASNAPDPDGLIVFRVQENGKLGTAAFFDAKAASPFYIAFLHDRPDTFIVGYAVGDGCAMGTIDVGGRINIGPLVKIDTSTGLPSELCWLSVSPGERARPEFIVGANLPATRWMETRDGRNARHAPVSFATTIALCVRSRPRTLMIVGS
jgi:hypothetical protein